jgi:hypothetical protein
MSRSTLISPAMASPPLSRTSKESAATQPNSLWLRANLAGRPNRPRSSLGGAYRLGHVDPSTPRCLSGFMGRHAIADYLELAEIPRENAAEVEQFLRLQDTDSNTLAVLERGPVSRSRCSRSTPRKRRSSHLRAKASGASSGRRISGRPTTRRSRRSMRSRTSPTPLRRDPRGWKSPALASQGRSTSRTTRRRTSWHSWTSFRASSPCHPEPRGRRSGTPRSIAGQPPRSCLTSIVPNSAIGCAAAISTASSKLPPSRMSKPVGAENSVRGLIARAVSGCSESFVRREQNGHGASAYVVSRARADTRSGRSWQGVGPALAHAERCTCLTPSADCRRAVRVPARLGSGSTRRRVYAAMAWYSWSRPPSRSRRPMLLASGGVAGGGLPSGGRCSSERCGRCSL